ncbi:MAG: Rieske 2Fe-2S domain-containing protein [Chloroflexi bacterium]|nr:Rieske 2Fe-2S domain-containing protein [Chloroflexota bacterium]
MDRWLARLVAAQGRWARPLGDFNHRWLHALFRPIPPVRDLLNGRWLGHPLHGVLTDAPIGILFLVIILDVLDLRTAADVALIVGILTMLASAVAGAADYADTDGTARERATVHSTLMVVALLVYVGSLAVRGAGGLGEADRTVAVWSSVVGFLILAAGAYVGGDVVYALGNMVSRHAFRGAATKWIALEPSELDDAGDIPEGRPVKARLGINSLALVRQGEAVLALHDTCAHAGGPLSEGTIEDGCLVCPWHFSKYRLSDGRAQRGPTVYDQPAYEVRRTEAGGWEARRRAT